MLWIVYFMTSKPKLSGFIGAAVFGIIWGGYLIFAYFQNWAMFVAGGVIRPKKILIFGKNNWASNGGNCLHNFLLLPI